MSKPDINGIGQIGIVSKDLEAATVFYRDVLQLPFLFSVPGMSFFDLGGTRLMLGQATPEHPYAPASIIYYQVFDIDAAVARLESRDVPMLEQPQRVHVDGGKELWLAFFRDTDGNVLAFMEQRLVKA